jgi:WD40 repeat protein/serine/threonine protein kinase/DNA-binding SARP family transcriptional activator
MSDLSIKLLGSFQVDFAAGSPVEFASDRVRALLAYLVTESDQPHRRDKLAGLFWPNSPQKMARTNLRRALSDLRKAIGDHQANPPYLLITRQSIQFNRASAAWVDVDAFVSVASQEVTAQSVEALAETAVFYQGHFLEGFYIQDALPFEEWALLKGERLQRQALTLLHRLVAYYETTGEYEHAVPHAWRQVELDPFQEPAQRQVMRLLALTGQRAAALSQYESLKMLLDEEMGMAPASKTTALYEKILADDLDLTSATETAVRGYELCEQIGAGRYGIVYRAKQLGVGRNVAVKIIQPKYANRPEFIRRFEAEAQLVARLENPYIVPLYDYWREPDGAFLVMRWLRGGSLQDALKDGPVEVETAVSIIDQIASALHAAHRQGIVHRDIKPANILLDDEGNAYLSDFGIAKDSRHEMAQLPEQMNGSSRAISPEQLLNEPVTPLSDVYSLGLVLYELLTGQHPFAGYSLAKMTDHCLHKPLPSVCVQRSELPRAVDTVLQQAAARHPSSRYPNALMLAEAFGNAVSGNGSPLTILADVGNPYRGLHAFQEADTDVFYGRSQFIKQLLTRFTPNLHAPLPTPNSRFLAVVGPSGSGKSSVVKAGLIPALRSGAIPGSDDWFIVEMTPGEHPLTELETALMPVAVNPPPSLFDPLQKDEHGLTRVLKRILPVNENGVRSQMVLLIDQFEELFTLVEDKSVRLHFLDSIVAALADPLSQLRVIVTLRADFYDRPLQYPPLGELLRQNSELVLPLTPDELQDVICKPAARVGVKVEPQLTGAIIADVQEQPGALPLLQYALTELFEQRDGAVMTLAAYQQIGGIAGAISRRAESLYSDLDARGQAATRQLFLRLVTLGEGAEDTRRRVLLSELAALQQTSDFFEKADVLGVVEDYGRFRLLTFDRDPLTRAPTVEVAHESLLHAWPRLRSWLDESRADVRQQRLLASAANEWRVAGKNVGFLLRGARLSQFSGWAETSQLALTQKEQAYLTASQAAKRDRQIAEEVRQQRELETVQQLANTERRRAEEQAGANRRLRWRALMLAGALIVATILAVLANSASRRASESAIAAQTEADQRATAEALAIQEREMAQVQERQAQARALAGAALTNIPVDPELSVLLALEAVKTTYTVDGTWTPEAVGALHHSINAASRLQRVLHYPGGAMNGLIYSPDGKLLGASSLLADQEVMTAVWDVATGEELFTLPTSIANFGEDGKRLITWHSTSSSVVWEVWDVATVEKVETIDLRINDLAWSAGGALTIDWKYFAVRYWDNRISVWDMTTQNKVLQSTEHDGLVNFIEFSLDGQFVATASVDGTAKVWQIPEDGTELEENAASLLTFEHEDAVEMFAFSPDNNYLATASRDFTAVIWDLPASIAAGEPVKLSTIPLTDQAEPVRLITFNADGSMLGIVSQDGVVKIWNIDTGEELPAFVSNNLTRGLAFDPNGSYLATRNDGGLVQIWDITPSGEKEWLTLTGHHGVVHRATYSPDGRQIATVSSDQTVKLWNADSGELLMTMSGHTGDVRAVAFCPDGTCLATASHDKTIRLWDVKTGEAVANWEAYAGLELNPIPENNVLDIAFTKDGGRLLAAGLDSSPTIWDVATSRSIRSLYGHWDYYNVVSTAVSPNGQYFATTGADGLLIVWDSKGGKVFVQPTTEYGGLDVAFSPDGRHIASAGNDGAVRIWDMDANQEDRLELTLSGHGSYVQSVAFSPDGRLIASASANFIRIWDTSTGKMLFTLPGHTRVVSHIEFSPDGSRLVSASADGTVRVFVLPIEELMQLAQSRLTRSLTEIECQQYLNLDSCTPVP